MTNILIQQLEAERAVERPHIEPGYLVAVHQRVKEGNKERTQIFEGMVLGMNGSGLNRTMTVRRLASGVNVEKVFPLQLPSIIKIEVKRKFKVRRARLNYVRGLSGKSLRFKEKKSA